MTEVIEHPHGIISDVEKSFVLWAKLNENMREIKESLQKDQLEIDMYADDPGGVTGVIGSSTGQTGGNLARQYNGPYIIRDIVATWGTTSENPQSSFQNFGSVTSVGALGTIAQITGLPAGEYQVAVTFNFIGAAAAIDASNIQIVVSSPALTVRLPNGDVSETPQNFAPITVPVNTGGSITLQAIVAGTVGVIYNATLVATPLTPGNPTSVVLKLADRTFQLAPEPGAFQVTDIAIKMARDDQILLTVTPPAPCHLEIMGYAEKRRTDHAG